MTSVFIWAKNTHFWRFDSCFRKKSGDKLTYNLINFNKKHKKVLKWGISMGTLNCHRINIYGWINLNFGMYGLYIFFECRFFSRRHGPKYEKNCNFGEKRQKTWFLTFSVMKMVKNGPNMPKYAIFVIYDLPYTNKENCFLFERKILIFDDLADIFVFSGFCIRT